MFILKKLITGNKLKRFCKENHIKKLSLFGSALKDNLHKDSDIDLLVEFEKGHIPGLMDLAGMEIELSKMTGRRIDLRTSSELSHYFRNDVLAGARVEYAS